MKKTLAILLCAAMLLTSAIVWADDGEFHGEADGFGGIIAADVTLTEGKITALTLTGDKETPTIGGLAIEALQQAILEAGTIDGIDVVTGATWTSKGVFNAIKNALGLDEAAEPAAEDAAPISASGLKHGLGIVVTPRLGPGSDDQEVPVYSFNVVIAYVVSDAEGRIVDAETDILEIITPNHDGAEDNALAGWPGASYNEDSDGDGKVDGVMEQTPENFTAGLPAWKTKRMLGSAYKMNSGTWEQEMDIFEAFFRGKTAEELQGFFARACSDRNGRPVRENSSNEDDLAKWNALSDEDKAGVDALTGATMSLSDAHGDILGAVIKALDSQKPIAAEEIASIGLGVVVTPRLGPGSDDQEVPVYSFNVVVSGVLLDEASAIAAAREDILEVITPNHDGANDNAFIGWPGQSYNTDDDGDGKVDGIAEQTSDSFVAMLTAFRTKRGLDSLYKMNSGTWAQEMDIFETFFAGKTIDELLAFYAKNCSDRNGRVIFASNTNEADLAKWNALSDEDKAVVDALTGATMSLSDAHGDLLGALEAAVNAAKPVGGR
ncbi:MAG: FMN-binding protein [Clostridia bacterium]|nr:FMN-binding protein [Clostridia bacterium]